MVTKRLEGGGGDSLQKRNKDGRGHRRPDRLLPQSYFSLLWWPGKGLLALGEKKKK